MDKKKVFTIGSLTFTIGSLIGFIIGLILIISGGIILYFIILKVPPMLSHDDTPEIFYFPLIIPIVFAIGPIISIFGTWLTFHNRPLTENGRNRRMLREKLDKEKMEKRLQYEAENPKRCENCIYYAYDNRSFFKGYYCKYHSEYSNHTDINDYGNGHFIADHYSTLDKKYEVDRDDSCSNFIKK